MESRSPAGTAAAPQTAEPETRPDHRGQATTGKSRSTLVFGEMSRMIRKHKRYAIAPLLYALALMASVSKPSSRKR